MYGAFFLCNKSENILTNQSKNVAQPLEYNLFKEAAMNDYPNFVKLKLDNTISKLNDTRWLFAKNPHKDFTRDRKLPFADILRFLLSVGGNSLNLEMMKYFSFSIKTPTPSAFIQQRDKILPEAFEMLFRLFTESAIESHTFKGYRLLAADGSDISIAHNPKDSSTYISNGPNAKGINLVHLNVIYDLLNRVYLDAHIEFGKEGKGSERRSLIRMVERMPKNKKTIIIADRGYENYNVFEHIAKKGMKYVIRVKDMTSNGIGSGLPLPQKASFDLDYEFLMTRRQTKDIRENPELYKFLPANQLFDFLPVGCKETYPFEFRIVRFPISKDSYELIITNLDRAEFPPDLIKELYHMRWGVETSFRELKYAIGLNNFHSKKVAYILQEIYARLTMYNFCEVITTHIIIHQKDRKYAYQVNFTIAIAICIEFFKTSSDMPPPDVEALIRKNILPVRPGRKDPRKVKSKSAVSFIYRVA